MNNERDLTAAFSKYLRKTKDPPAFLKRSFVIEYKWLKKGRFNFKSDLKAHQIPSLLQAKNECLYSKISDMSLGLKPFDAFNVCGVDTWLGISWDKILYFLDASFVEAYSKKHKSITREEIIINSKYNIIL